MTPYLSVIVPVYRAEPWLRACADSILGQTLRELELILVDDGSPDGCPAICDEYAKKDPRVRVLHKANGGVASAVAAGIRAAEGAFIGFIDSDDWIDPDYYGELYRCITEQDADMVEGLMTDELQRPDGWQKSRDCVRAGTVAHSGPEAIRRLTGRYMTSFLYDGAPDRPLSYSKCDKLFRRRLVTDNLAYYDERLSLGEDAVLIAAVLPDCGKVVTLKSAARYHRRVLSGSVSHQTGSEQIRRIAAVGEALRRLADGGKPLDRAAVDAFIGSMVHTRIYRAAALPDMQTGEKGKLMKDMLRQAPAGALEAFLRLRDDGSLRVFYGLLRLGLTAPCVWMASLHGAMRKKE